MFLTRACPSFALTDFQSAYLASVKLIYPNFRYVCDIFAMTVDSPSDAASLVCGSSNTDVSQRAIAIRAAGYSVSLSVNHAGLSERLVQRSL